MQLTKTQIIALFLGSTSAANPQEMLDAQLQITNQNDLQVTDPVQSPWLFADTLSEQSDWSTGQDLTILAHTPCGGAITPGCTTIGHVCADIYSDKDRLNDEYPFNRCVNAKNCGNMAMISRYYEEGGLEETNAYHVNCWAEGATEPPEKVDVLAMIDIVGGIILEDSNKKDFSNFSTYEYLFLTAKDQFMGGWWTAPYDADEILWKLNPKQEIEGCVLDTSCEAGERCAWWPDQNNKRCQLAAVCNVEQTLAPFANWTPTCDGVADNGPPISAQDDLANKALAKAESAIEEFAETQLSDAKTAAKYDEMTDADKEAWDKERATQTGKRDEFDAKLRTDAGFAELSTEEKNIFESELLVWKKAVYEACKADEKSIECKDFEALKEEEETRRNTGGFYAKDAEAREAFTEAGESEVAQKKAALTAAFMESNKPAAGSGEEGADCKAETATCADTQCCGVSTPKGNAVGVTDGQLDDICVDSTTKVFTDGLGREYTHLCEGAKALLASASALVAAVYFM